MLTKRESFGISSSKKIVESNRMCLLHAWLTGLEIRWFFRIFNFIKVWLE